jgi:ribosomal-protein-alanine acetyltransferase
MATMSLEVRVSNEVAINLYKGHGFEIVGVRKQYYQDNKEDAYIMYKYF